jgi:hypothetical protein
MTHEERLNTLMRRAHRRGPACGRRYIVNSTFHTADIFFCALFDIHETWIGTRRWRRRYKALKRSRRTHGHSTQMIGLLSKITKEWRGR